MTLTSSLQGSQPTPIDILKLDFAVAELCRRWVNILTAIPGPVDPRAIATNAAGFVEADTPAAATARAIDPELLSALLLANAFRQLQLAQFDETLSAAADAIEDAAESFADEFDATFLGQLPYERTLEAIRIELSTSGPQVLDSDIEEALILSSAIIESCHINTRRQDQL